MCARRVIRSQRLVWERGTGGEAGDGWGGASMARGEKGGLLI